MPTDAPPPAKGDPFDDPAFAHVPPLPGAAGGRGAAPRPPGPGPRALALAGGALLLGGAGLFGGGVLAGAHLVHAAARPLVIEHDITARIGDDPPAPVPYPPVLAEDVRQKLSVPVATAGGPRVEVVFAVDTTGSMGGLLRAAKEKVWAVVDAVAGQRLVDPRTGARVRPRVAFGLVAYRDCGDDYVTRSVPLTEDIDALRAALVELRAAGGGDGPEAVGEALRVATDPAMGWSDAQGTARVVFLVGDAPAKDGLAALEAVDRARPRGIAVSAVLCGQDPEARADFVEYARRGDGRLLEVEQRPATVAVATPQDAAIAAVQRRIEATLVPFGQAKEQASTRAQWASNQTLDAEGYATRSSALCKTGRFYGGDLLQALDDGRARLEDVTPEQVGRPDVVQGGRVSAARVAALRAERAAARAELEGLVAARDAWLAAHRADGASLDRRLVEALLHHLTAAGLEPGC